VSRCASVQERLADEGAALLDRDADMRAHVGACPHCTAFVEALKQVETGLSRLPANPAPRALLKRTAEAVAGESKAGGGRGAADAGAKKLASALAAMVVLAAGFGLTTSVQQEVDRLQSLYGQTVAGGYAPGASSLGDESRTTAATLMPPVGSQARVQAQDQSSPAEPAMLESEALSQKAFDALTGAVPERLNAPVGDEEAVLSSPAAPAPSMADLAATAKRSKEQKKDYRQRAAEVREDLAAGMALGNVATPAPESEADSKARRSEAANQSLRIAADPGDDGSMDADKPVAQPLPEFRAADMPMEAVQILLREMPGKAGRAAGVNNKLESAAPGARGALAPGLPPVEVARRFLADQERLTGLAFQSGSGYWANTYVPGDPAIRLLEARLQRWNRGVLRAAIGDPHLETSARQNWQPFDLPRNAALAAYLHADKSAVHGPSRLRVQVGLQASQKRSGLRVDMNVGVVLDMRRPLDASSGAKMRALVTALAKARQPGDRFSITVAGHPGGLLVAPEAFRHGPIHLAMQRLFAGDGEVRAPAMDLLAALHSASHSVRQSDDASAPLGASLVLLVSTAPIAEQRESLERMAHENAVAGIGLSVVALGAGADLDSIDRLVLLGQGHRRILLAAEDAAKLVDRELHAASRAVARAVRLRIRLAPGVELIDVLGSENLSEQAAQRVRDAERSIDQRVARNIGIRADRGEDEEGIQIVIPSFFAGDSHTVLLDVVVPGPGPVADVSVRYKDLVYRRNGIARTRLVMNDGQRARGPLELNVLKNRITHELARSASLASRQLGAGDRTGAVETLTAARQLLAGMRAEIPGWDNDAELGSDQALLTSYLQALGSQFAAAGVHRQRIADSLRFLAFRRLIAAHE
jgi:hypothetical protein